MTMWSKLPWKRNKAQPQEANSGAAYERMFAPTPLFMGQVFAFVFLDENIGLTTEERNRLVSQVPEGLRRHTGVWVYLYLAWALSKFVEERYGADFCKESIAAIGATAERIDRPDSKELVRTIADAVSYWFPVFDVALTVSDDPECPLEIKDAPKSFLIAFSLLKHGPSGPIFLADEDAAQRSLSGVLREALEMKWHQLQRAAELGAPLKEVRWSCGDADAS